MRVVCWNINNFTANRLADAADSEVFCEVINQYDVAVILEGPHGAGAAAAAAVNALGGGWAGIAVNTDAPGGEAESVVILSRATITIANAAVWQCASWPGGRRPVRFEATGASHAGAGAPITRIIVGWHAPSPQEINFSLISQGWREILAQAALEKSNHDNWFRGSQPYFDFRSGTSVTPPPKPEPPEPPDAMMGDFNVKELGENLRAGGGRTGGATRPRAVRQRCTRSRRRKCQRTDQQQPGSDREGLRYAGVQGQQRL